MATTKSTELGQLGRLLSVDSSGVVITGPLTVGSIIGDGSGLTGVTSYVESDFFADLQLDSARTIIRGYFSGTGDITYDSATGQIGVTLPPGYTTTDFNSDFATKSTSDLTEGTNLYYTSVRVDSDFDARLATKTTTDLAEGTNLYYTTVRFDSDFGVKTTTDLTEGSNLYYTDGRFDTRLATKSTSDLSEGTNLYYTTVRADSDTAAYLVANGYDTATNIIASIVDAAPTTLDTLNELAAALGDDPNFATTVTNSLATKYDSDDVRTLVDSDYVRARAAKFINDTYVFSATAGQTVFTGLDDNSATLSYTPNNLLVQVNGVILLNGEDFTATDGSTVTLTVPADSGDDVVVNAFSSFDVTFGQAFEQDYEYNATAGQTIFANSDQNGNVLNVNTQGTIVTLNGLTLRATDDYSISQTAVTLTTAADSGDELLIRTFKKLSVADTVSATNGGTFSSHITAKTVKAAQPFFVNELTVTEDYSIASGTSAMAAGPITINSGVTVSIASGSRWVIV